MPERLFKTYGVWHIIQEKLLPRTDFPEPDESWSLPFNLGNTECIWYVISGS